MKPFKEFIAESTYKPLPTNNGGHGLYGSTKAADREKVWDSFSRDIMKVVGSFAPKADATDVRNFLDSAYGRHLAGHKTFDDAFRDTYRNTAEFQKQFKSIMAKRGSFNDEWE